jgi:hypothetical protein
MLATDALLAVSATHSPSMYDDEGSQAFRSLLLEVVGLYTMQPWVRGQDGSYGSGWVAFLGLPMQP